MIDPATGWFEIHQYDDKRSITVANIAEQEWFSRYPWHTQMTYDRDSEFIGKDFQSMIKNDYGIKGKPITVRNPIYLVKCYFFVSLLPIHLVHFKNYKHSHLLLQKPSRVISLAGLSRCLMHC
jgi:hypothetical protein